MCKLSEEGAAYNFERVDKYTGSCTVITSTDEFYSELGYPAAVTQHPDGVYGWRRLVTDRELIHKSVSAPHMFLLRDKGTIPVLAQTITSQWLHSTPETNSSPAHLSRHASSLEVPQEDSLCGDGPSVQHTCGSGQTLLQNSDAPVARCPDAPIESTAPL